MTGWPAVRTDPARAPARLWPTLLVATLGTLVGAFLVGSALSMIVAALRMVLGPTAVSNTVWAFAAGLVYSPVLSWIGLIAAAPLAVWALRRGRAGWAVACGAGALVGLVVYGVLGGPLVETLIFGGGTGLALGGLYWLSACLFAPDAFRR